MPNTHAVASQPSRHRGPVGRKRTKQFKPGETMPMTFRLEAEVAEALDAEAERLTEEMGFPVTRVDVIRRWLKESAERAKQRGK